MVYTEVKNKKQRLKVKQGNVKETYQYNVCAPPNTATQNRAQIWMRISQSSYVFINDMQNTVIFCHNFKEYSKQQKKNLRAFIRFWYQNNMIKIYQHTNLT